MWTEKAPLGHQVLVGFSLSLGWYHLRKEAHLIHVLLVGMDQKMLNQIVFNLITFLVILSNSSIYSL